MLRIETDCTIEHKGQTYRAGGAVISPDRIIAYVGKQIGGRGFNGRLGNEAPIFELTTWHGEVIGTCRIGSSWPTPRSWITSYMHQIYATVDGIEYTGRSAGSGMIYRGKRCKS